MISDSSLRSLVVWLGLSVITGISWWTGAQYDHHSFRPDAAITISIILFAAVKVRIIMREFMDVRHAQIFLRRVTDIWLLGVVIALLGVYAFGMAGKI